MPALYTLTLFVSAALLFLVQPMIARMLLPLFGGTPAVWNTCMVFFQALLLAGYGYAHVATARLGSRRQAMLHLAVLLLPLAVLPLTVPTGWSLPNTGHPVAWLLGLLLVTVGLPFFVVSTSGPLMQRWFADSGHPAASDPYFLYAASNSGSMLALLAYPFLLEPNLTLAAQGRVWAAGYGLLVLLTAACGAALLRAPAPKDAKAIGVGPDPATPPVTSRRRLRWVLLAFVPSSLLLGVTNFITTNVAPVPLLWVLPLALYLATFILAFARSRVLPPGVLFRWLPLAALLVVFVLLDEGTELPVGVLAGVHLFGLFWVATTCHCLLAGDRPPAGRLTEFYLWLSAGGVLGGLFNALVAPVFFAGPWEYPLVLVLACVLRPAPPWSARPGWWDLALPAGLGALTAGLVLSAKAYGLPPGELAVGVMFGLPAVLCYTFVDRPVRFALGLGALLLAAGLFRDVHGTVLYRTRSFFGIHRVTLDPSGAFHMLVHGNTVHGQQSVDPARRGEPLTYYHRTGPAGRVFAALRGDERLWRVALVGLGAGALACYGEEGQEWTYYEIDPAVERIARDGRLFTFLSDAERRGVRLGVVPGDARLTLARRGEPCGVLVVDAFSSDAIPVHLLTREALRVYLGRLRDDGVLAFNISNRYLDLEPVLAGLARDAGLECFVCEDLVVRDDEKRGGKAPSIWAVMARRRGHLAKVLADGRWQPARPRAGMAVWSDDFSNLFGVLKTGGE